MPQFTTISPTHVPGKKSETWARFRDGHYIAIGWLNDVDLSSMTRQEIASMLEERQEPSWEAGQTDLISFVHDLRIGDIVAVTNANHSIFGIGRITSPYRFDKDMHDTGDDRDRYSHLRSVEWLSTVNHERTEIVLPGETSWEPRGTLGQIQKTVPPFIRRLLNIETIETLESSVTDLNLGDIPKASGQAFQCDPELRNLVERHAVEQATSYYEDLHYTVTEKGKPYDLRCLKDGKELLVEVKGTTARGDFILLTKNEVALARKASMELFLLSEINISETLTGRVASGGKTKVIKPWTADEKGIEPYAYIYRVI